MEEKKIKGKRKFVRRRKTVWTGVLILRRKQSKEEERDNKEKIDRYISKHPEAREK